MINAKITKWIDFICSWFIFISQFIFKLRKCVINVISL